MNKLLITVGTIFALLWGFVTAMSVGLPLGLCRAIDKMTFHSMSDAVLKMNNGFYYDNNNSDMPTVMFLVICGVAFSLFLFLIFRIEKIQPQKYSLGIVIGFSILLRLILLPSEPIHENDFYRYLWDGKSINYQINPYKYAPSDLLMYEYGYTEDYYDDYNDVTIKGRAFSEDEQEQLKVLLALRDNNSPFYDRIGHWQISTIYPPVAEIIFAAASWIKPDSYLGIKFLFILFDLGVIFVIIALLKHFHKNPCMSLIYAWSPLVLKEFANSGHYDPIPIFFTMLSIYFLVVQKKTRAIGVLALATLSKFFSGVLLPLYLRTIKQRYVLLFGAIILLFYLPFMAWGSTGFSGVFAGLFEYNKYWSYNSSIFAIIYTVLDNISPKLSESLMPAKVIAGLMYLGVLIYLYLKKEKGPIDILHKCFVAIAALFIINPVGDPWYFCWAVPFLCFFPYRSWLLLSGLLMLSYLNFQADFTVITMKVLNIPLMSWIIYVPFFMVLGVELYLKRKNKCKDAKEEVTKVMEEPVKKEEERERELVEAA